MNVVFRVDSSIQMGIGHVMRCLTLAQVLKENGENIEFICRKHKGSLIDKIRSNGFIVHELGLLEETEVDTSLAHSHWLGATQQQDANDCIDILKAKTLDWLIVDHYALDEQWQKRLKPYCEKLMVIDDLANRNLDCDILLDQNYCDNFENRYDKLVPKNCKKFLGPRFLILRDEFLKLHKTSKKNKKTIRKIMLFFGGSDDSHETIKVVKILPFIKNLDLSFDIVLGKNNSDIKKIIDLCRHINKVSIHIQIDNMAEIMSKTDLAIIAGGSTVWEACCLGTPIYTVVTAENQNIIISYLDKIGVINNIGLSENITSEDMLKSIEYACSHAYSFFKMGYSASKIIHSCGSSIGNVVSSIVKDN